VTVYWDNQPVVRTNNQGRATITGLRAYQTNAISINPRATSQSTAGSNAK
jgi:outer membrane usher protein FimD/PapC